MVTRTRMPGRMVTLAAGAFALLLAGCGGGEDAVAGFTGGTKSTDKKPIPSAVQASATTTQATTTPAPAVPASATPKGAGMKGPAVAAKSAVSSDRKDKAPIREQSNQYRAGRNRDPFASLIGSDERTDLVDLSVVRLVGVVTSGDRPFAIVEDGDGMSYVLRKGDRVKSGRVVRVTSDALVCSQTMLGYTTTIQLKLVHGKDVKNG